MNKKMLSLIAVLMLFALVITACQQAEPVETAETSEEQVAEEAAAAEETEEKFFIGMVQHSAIPFTEQMKVGYEAACKDLPIECEYNAPETINPETAIGMFDAMVTKGVDAVVLNPNPPEAWTKVIKSAVDSGIQVNVIDNPAEAESGFGVFISPDNTAVAQVLAEEFFAQLKAKGVTEGTVVYGICAPGVPDQELRADGWEAACSAQSDFECVGPLDTGGTVELDYAFWETTVLQYPDAVAFAGNCAFDGPNLVKVKQATGGEWDIATFDLEPETLTAIQDGSLLVAMGANPWLNAYLGTKLAYEYLVSGESIPQGWINSGPELVTADNVEEFLARENDVNLKYEYHKALLEEKFSDLGSLIQPMPF